MEDAASLVRRLGLKPLPREGGFFVETFRSPARVPTPCGERAASTAILYLLTPESHSAIHRIPFDEVWHFHAGDPVELLVLGPGARAAEVVLGPDLEAGMRVQAVVPGGCWQGALLRPGGRGALLGTTVAPGFESGDWEPGDPAALAAAHPALADRILALAPRP